MKQTLARCIDERDRLRHTTRRYRKLVSLFTDYTYELRRTAEGAYIVQWLSDAFSDLTGYPNANLKQRATGWHDIAHPADTQRVRQHLAALRAGKASEAKYRIATKDDTVRWIADRAVPVTDASEEATTIYGAVSDITERRAAEQRQQWQEEYRLRLYHVTSANDIAFEDKLHRLLQLGVERLGVENGFLSHIHPANDFFEIVEASAPHPLLKKGQTSNLSATYCRKAIASNEILGVYNAPEQGWTMDPAYEKYGLGCYLGAKIIVDDELYGTVCFADRTPRSTPFSHAEKTFVELVARWISHMLERRKHRMKLRREKLRFQRLVEGVDNYAIFMLDPDGYVVSWNAGAERIKGYASDEILGRHFSVFYPPEAREQNEPQRVLKTAIQEGQYQAEGKRLRKDGSTFIAHVNLTPIYDDNGHLEGFSKVTRDITAQKRHEEALLEAKERAEEMSRIKTAFLANMSHEIRTPLTSIIGFAELIEDNVSNEEAEMARLIKISGRRLLETLNSVLDLSMLESDTFALDVERLDLSEAVRAKLPLMQPQAAAKGLTLTARTPDTPVPVRLDDAALDRVLNNLIDNAIKFTEHGQITVKVETQGDNAFLRVRDTGVGIDEAFLPDLFEEFTQESAGIDRSHEGTGLGLAIVKRLVEAMGGYIKVDSRKGEGTTFTLSFPLAAT